VLHFTSTNSICAQVSNRDKHLRDFARANDLVIFVAGKNSSNGKYLYSVCHDANPNTHLVSSPEALQLAWFDPGQKVGVSGATSTPHWLLEAVAAKISNFKRS
jgi:4-hydroxy-3-methylbut-2-enyl diphosphate reductase